MYSHETSKYLNNIKNGNNHISIPITQKDYENHCNLMQSIWGPPRFDVLDVFLLNYNFDKMCGDNFYHYCEQGQYELAKKCCVKDDTKKNEYRIANCCEKGYFEMAQWLYQLGIDLDSNSCGNKAFEQSCLNGHVEIAKWLHSLQSNATFDYCEAFVQSCSKGSLESAKWLHSLTDTKSYHNTAFMLACIGGHYNTIKWLHSIGVDIHIGNEWAFRLSCRNGNIEMAKILFKMSADIHAGDEDALRLSCVNGHFEIAMWLHSLGADICVAVSNKNTLNKIFYFETTDVFLLVCLNNHFKIAEFIHSYLIIDTAIIENSFEIVCGNNDTLDMAKWLYSIINDVKKISKPFEVACRKGNFETAKWLLSLDSMLIVDLLAPDTINDFLDEEHNQINNILHNIGYSNQTVDTISKIINKQLLDQYDEIDNDTILHILAKYNRIDDLKKVKHQHYKYISYDIIDDCVVNFSIKYIKVKNARSFNGF